MNVVDRQLDRLDLGVAVTAALREMILSGELRPGERLVETDLARTFGTSRGPVRDALAELARVGLVSVVNRRGAFVASMSDTDIDELYSLRLALELLAVRRAAPTATDNDVASIDAALADLHAALDSGDPRSVADADMRFHRTIVAAAGHRRLLEAWEVFADQTALVMQELNVTRPDVQSNPGGHAEIAAAFAARDAERAAAALAAHLDAARESMLGRAVGG